MPWYVIVIIVFVASVILSVFISLPLYLAIKTTHPIHLSREEVTSLWKEKRFASEYDKSLRKDITFTMNDGYIIHGDYMLYPGSKKFVICCHGYSVNREAELEYGLIFYRLGYNVVLFDERGHGDNAAFISTMGYLESKDLNQIIDQVKDKFGLDSSIGLHGVSMGAAVSLFVTKYRSDIEFIVEDCGYVNFKNVLTMQVNKGHLPGVIFAPLASFTSKLLYKFSFKDASIEPDLEKIDVPMLIIHGDIDESVPVKNAHILNEKINCKHKMVLYHSKHANALTDYRLEYEKEVEEFLASLNSD